MSNYYQFPQSFIWGCATASYQVEGAVAEDERGPSVWDTFSHAPGRTAMDHNGDIACDQYHRYKEDVELMKWMGLKAYRFSIAWGRIFPEGFSKPNEKGIAYYDRLIDELLGADIEPWPTLFHWDLPQVLEDRFDGWESIETAKYFAEYAAYVAKRLSDRVHNFMTTNEIASFCDAGYITGDHAPGKRLPADRANQVRHNALLAHGMAVRAIRDNAKGRVNVGLAENPKCPVPVVETDDNIAAARSAMRHTNGMYLTPILEGKYPDTYLRAQGNNAPKFTDNQMEIIGTQLDFVGLNVYSPVYVRHCAESADGFEVLEFGDDYPRVGMPWLHLGPTVTYWGPRFLNEIWGVKNIYITENGCACQDSLSANGEVNDLARIMYLRNHFISAHRALCEDWPLKGYFVWTLLDNFEWHHGYTKRFGLTYVNYETLERIPKLSAKFYREVISKNAIL